jgi:hypothetical protein
VTFAVRILIPQFEEADFTGAYQVCAPRDCEIGPGDPGVTRVRAEDGYGGSGDEGASDIEHLLILHVLLRHAVAASNTHIEFCRIERPFEQIVVAGVVHVRGDVPAIASGV